MTFENQFEFAPETRKAWEQAGSNLLTPPVWALIKVRKGEEHKVWNEILRLEELSFDDEGGFTPEAEGDVIATLVWRWSIDGESGLIRDDGVVEEPSPNVGRAAWTRHRFNYTQYNAAPEAAKGQAKMTAIAIGDLKTLLKALGADEELAWSIRGLVDDHASELAGMKVVATVSQGPDAMGVVRDEIRRFAELPQ